MKILKLITFLMMATFLSITTIESSALTITKLGKGGAVIQPNGNYKLCPQFAFKKCCKITLTWKELWNWITDGGCWDDDINTNLPLHGNAVVYDDDGLPVGSYNVEITWINPSSCAVVNGGDITVDHPDIHVEVVQ